ncbi:MAG: VOC family protein [Candidatus Azobacteroides sp.]|nr:VOC family protein [Candidatus Azobacteroides sp.]
MLLEPYLIFDGNCEEAFNFYKSLFGGDFTSFVRYKELIEGNLLPKAEQDRILFISLPIGEGIRLMGADVTSENKVSSGDNIALSLSLGTLEEEDTKYFFNKLSEGGEVLMPFQETYWSDKFGMCRDKFGIQWRINYKVTEYM